MTASSLYKIMDSFSVYDSAARLTINGQDVEGVTLDIVADEEDDDIIIVSAMNIHTAKDEVCAV